MEAVKNVLKSYEKVSGLKVNFQKSGIVFGRNVEDEAKDEICKALDILESEGKGKYLGSSTLDW